MQRLILLAVFAASAWLWVALYWQVIRPWWRKRRGRPLAAPPAVWQRVLIGLLCLVYLGCFLYARYDEPNRLVLRRLRLTSAKIPAGQTLRLVQATDLHAEQGRQRHLERTAEAIAALHPDAVFLTGDYLCDFSTAAMTALVDFLLRLPDAPVFVVPGNYEGLFPSDGLFETLGMDVMHTETRLVTIKGVPVEIHGASPSRRMLWVRPRQAPERFGIFLEHFPAQLPQAADAGWDLALFGHTHGGQVRLPGYGALITFDTAGKNFEMGGYRWDRLVGFVSAGVGMECRGILPPVRFLAPPEIVLIEVTGIGK